MDTIEINGVKMIVANNKGISVFDTTGIKDKAHHYCIAPVHNMPIDKYKGLLEEMALLANRIYKKEGKAV